MIPPPEPFPHALPPPPRPAMVALETPVLSLMGDEDFRDALSPGNRLADLESLDCFHVNTLSAESRRKDNPSKLSGNPHKQLRS